MRNSRRWLHLVSVSVLVLLPGCLEFKKQTLLIKFDDKSEKITCLSVYEGFYAGGWPKKSALIDAKDDLAKFVGDKPKLYLFSRLFDVDLAPEPTDQGEGAAATRRLAPHWKLSRGELLLNEQGELSGFKTLTIFDKRAFEKLVNDMISEEVLKETDSLGVSEETEKLVRKAAKDGRRWVSLSSGQIIMDIPMTGKEADETIAGWTQAKDDPSQTNSVREAIRMFQVSKTDHGLKVTIGDGENRVLTFQSERNEDGGAMEKEVLNFAKTLLKPIDMSQNTKALIEKFRSM